MSCTLVDQGPLSFDLLFSDRSTYPQIEQVYEYVQRQSYSNCHLLIPQRRSRCRVYHSRVDHPVGLGAMSKKIRGNVWKKLKILKKR